MAVALEEPRDEGGRHAGPGVGHADGDAARERRVRSGRDEHRLGAVLLAVADQVGQDLLEPQRVGVRRKARRAVHLEVEVGEAGGALDELLAELEHFRRDHEVAVFQGGRGEEVLGEQREPTGQHPGPVQHPAGQGAVEIVVAEHLEVALQAGQRRPQVVADHGAEVVAEPGRLDELRIALLEPTSEPSLVRSWIRTVSRRTASITNAEAASPSSRAR